MRRPAIPFAAQRYQFDTHGRAITLRQPRSGLPGCALAVSSTFLALVAYAYLARPDRLAWLTIWPVWLWLLPGLLLLAPAIVKQGRQGWLVGCAWLLGVALLADEPPGLLPHGRPPAHDLRVITLNCAGGQAEPVEALAAWQPDVILLQEAPSARDCWTAAGRIWDQTAKAHWSFETAVLSRFRLHERGGEPLTWCQTEVELGEGRTLQAISLRLAPVPLCFNLLSRRCRAGLVDNRLHHREQLRPVAERVESLGESTAVIVAGDFNAPAGDAIVRLFPDWLHDSWRMAGRGWGDTCLSSLPVSRIDQIWVGGPLRPVNVQVVAVPGSDHRAVIADLVWASGGQ